MACEGHSYIINSEEYTDRSKCGLVRYYKKHYICKKCSNVFKTDAFYSLICPGCGETLYSDSVKIGSSDGYYTDVFFKCKKCGCDGKFDYSRDGRDPRGNV